MISANTRPHPRTSGDAVTAASAGPFFYRTAVGAEIDLLLDIPGHGLWAIDIKRGLTALPDKGFHIACDDVKPARRFVVNAGSERYSAAKGLEAISLVELSTRLLSA